MSDLARLYLCHEAARRWMAESENASARLELARIDERMAKLTSDYEPIHSLGVDREVMRRMFLHIRHGRSIDEGGER